MKKAAKLNKDACEEGGTFVSSPQQSVYINNELVCVVGTMTSPHTDDLIIGKFTSGSGTVKCENQSVCREGDDLDCGHNVSNLSEKVFVGD